MVICDYRVMTSALTRVCLLLKHTWPLHGNDIVEEQEQDNDNNVNHKHNNNNNNDNNNNDNEDNNDKEDKVEEVKDGVGGVRPRWWWVRRSMMMKVCTEGEE